jgi:dTDP-4-dehydrorhamnose reductase
MKVLIVGASGLIGGNIFEHFVNSTNWEITGTFNQYSTGPFMYLNASDKTSWPSFIYDQIWDVIIHTGALTNVDECEVNPVLSEYQTVQSSINLSTLAKQTQSKLVYFSTDYIFDGKSGPYLEDAKPNPLNVYGQHKLHAEKYIVENVSDYLILRVTNVYGHEQRNKNFVSRIILSIQEKAQSEFYAPFDQFATPINAFDIARACFNLIRDNKTGIYHISSTDYMSRSQLLQKLDSYFGANLMIKPVSTDFINQKASRPHLGGLISSKYLSEYPDFRFNSIDDYLKKHYPN